MKNQAQKKSTLIGIAAVIIVAVICGGGFLAWKYYLELEEKEGAETLEIEIPKDETADWLTYRSDEYGFEIKYPSDLNISDEMLLSTGTEVNFLKNNDIVFSIRVGVHYSQELMRNYTLDEWISSLFPLREGETQETIDIDGYNGTYIKAYKEVGVIKLIPYVFLEKDNNIWELIGNIPSTSSNLSKDYNVYEVFDQMISTFKFID